MGDEKATNPQPPQTVITFQACIGPSMGKLHLRETRNREPKTPAMTLCEGSTAVADYRWSAISTNLCQACIRRYMKLTGKIKGDVIYPADFGLEEIL